MLQRNGRKKSRAVKDRIAWWRIGRLRQESEQGENYWRRVAFAKLVFITVLLAAALIAAGFSQMADASSQIVAFSETQVFGGPGDQLAPASDGTDLFFLDKDATGSARLMRGGLSGGVAQDVLPGTQIWAGPVAGSGVVWQDAASRLCQRLPGGDVCVETAQADALKASGNNAIISEAGTSTIRLVGFDPVRNRMLDSYTSPGMRYDPAVDSTRAVWVRERGYAGKYYEPILVSYDLASGVTSYLTKTGGGTAANGDSRYERRHPVINNNRVFYQQRINEPGEQWDIYEADPAGFGNPVVEAPGDQVNPASSGDLLVYQDNRNGYYNAGGQWVDNWDIYAKNLETGVETAVCTASGDQVNPVVIDETIYWEDNRNGDWDIYGDVGPAVQIGEPKLELSINRAFWSSYSDYLARTLTVSFCMKNSGDGEARDVQLSSITTIPASVLPDPVLPSAIASIQSDGSADLQIRFYIPSDVTRFRTSMVALCSDAAGHLFRFPALA